MFLPNSVTAYALLLALSQLCPIRCAHIPAEFLVPQDRFPLNSSDTSGQLMRRDITDADKERLDQLSNSFKGIYWETAFPGAGTENGGCTIDEFNILAEATRMAIQLADFSGYALPKEDPYFHRFFVRDRLVPPGGRWTSLPYQTAYGNLHHNLLIPSRYPVNGAGSGRRATRVTYSCIDPPTLPTPPNGGCAAGMPAYTLPSPFTLTGITTVFCPLFFAAGNYLNDITSGPPRVVGDLGSLALISYEQMIVHEWMHAIVMGYSMFVDDITDSLSISDPTPYRVYGMSRCMEYAWKFMSDPCCPHINPGTVRNADNYAWYFAYKYYGNFWGWTADGTPPTLSSNASMNAAIVDYIGTPPPPLSNTSLTDALIWPPNCTTSDNSTDAVNITITCVFDPSAPDDAVAIPLSSTSTSASLLPMPTQPLTGPCNCNEDGCTDDSPVCCANGTCP